MNTSALVLALFIAWTLALLGQDSLALLARLVEPEIRE